MPDLATALKEEIRRLARIEAKKETAQLRKASAQYRRDLAELKREIKAAKSKLNVVKSEQRRVAETPKTDLRDRRFSAKGLRSHRAKLGLSAEDYGKLVGVTGQAIRSWESRKSRPSPDKFAALIELRGIGKRAAMARLAEVDEE